MKIHWENKEGLDQAFKDLRKTGLIARQDFTCCGSCGSYEIAEKFGELKPEKQAKVKGALFYHRQDSECANEQNILYLRYGKVEHQPEDRRKKKVESPLSDKKVGEMVVEAMTRNGVPTYWNGDPDFCIRAFPDTKTRDEYAERERKEELAIKRREAREKAKKFRKKVA